MPDDNPAPVSVAGVIDIYSDGSITVGDAARLLGCTREAINSHIRQGAPCVFRGKAGVASRISLGDYLAWKADRDAPADDFDDDDDGAGPPTTDKARYERARARRQEILATTDELELRRIRGELIPRSMAVGCIEDRFTACASKLRTIAHRVAPRVALMSEQREIADYLQREIAVTMTDVTDAVTALDDHIRRG